MLRSSKPSAALLAALMVVATARAQSELVIQKEGGSQYHWPGCPLVADGLNVLALTRAQAEGRGLKPHADCDPSKAGAAATTGQGQRSSGRSGQSRPPPPVFVQVDDSKYYHRENCRNLRDGSARMALETAGKKFWPCPVCKPPIRRKPVEPAVPRGIRR